MITLIVFQYCCVNRGRVRPADVLFSLLFALKLCFCFISPSRAFNYKTESDEEMYVRCGASREAHTGRHVHNKATKFCSVRSCVYRDVLVATAVHWLPNLLYGIDERYPLDATIYLLLQITVQNLHTVHKTTHRLLRTSATTPSAEHHME